MDGTIYPDRLEMRLSTAGASTNVGTTATSVGDFTTVLVEVNPTLAAGGYPEVWTQYTATLSGIPGGATGRIAWRYFVTDAGPTGANSDYIGIDTVEFTSGGPAATCDAPSNVPWLSEVPTNGTTAGGGSRPRSRSPSTRPAWPQAPTTPTCASTATTPTPAPATAPSG